MVNNCPYCGNYLSRPIRNGLTSCNNCNAIFQTTGENKLLSASWQLRRKNMGMEQFKFLSQLSNEDAKFVYYYVVEEGYSHEEFIQLVRHRKKLA